MPLCLRVPAVEAEHAIRALKSSGLYARGYKAKRLDDGTVALPVNDAADFKTVRGVLRNFSVAECLETFEGGDRGLTFKDMLKGLIPDDDLSRIPSSYDVVGDVAIVNMPEDLSRYGRLVGEAIVRLSPNIRAVYAGGSVSGDFRVRALRHVYGENISKTVHKEYGLSISVDVLRTYYNPSLSEEHRRVAELINEGEVVGDLFCGVGPFSLHMASLKRVSSYAVDLNPDAIKCLLESIELNKKMLKGSVVPVLDDVKDFLTIVRDEAFDRIIMNLPHKAIEYLEMSCSKVRKGGMIHLYTVSTSEAEAIQSVQKASESMRLMISGTRRVLDYAPRKYVFRVDMIKD
ncbi:MAG: class I SAM-dependent methyltransferase family protein [Zestosphaera sp.]